jgi:hypothetical protein
MKIEMTSIVDVTPEKLAEIFCALDDDQQCKFFVHIHAIASNLPHWDNELWYLAGHLRNCECSNDGTREMLRNLVANMETSTHG